MYDEILVNYISYLIFNELVIKVTVIVKIIKRSIYVGTVDGNYRRYMLKQFCRRHRVNLEIILEYPVFKY